MYIVCNKQANLGSFFDRKSTFDKTKYVPNYCKKKPINILLWTEISELCNRNANDEFMREGNTLTSPTSKYRMTRFNTRTQPIRRNLYLKFH